jgi:hypothetical protein
MIEYACIGKTQAIKDLRTATGIRDVLTDNLLIDIKERRVWLKKHAFPQRDQLYLVRRSWPLLSISVKADVAAGRRPCPQLCPA